MKVKEITGYPKVEDLIGRVFTSVKNNDNFEIIFENDTEVFTFYHEQDCCEHVYVEDIVGDLSDLEGVPILKAEEVSNEDEIDSPDCNGYESYTWTFYKFATRKGYVDIRWFGGSNGYYSERVSLNYVKKEK